MLPSRIWHLMLFEIVSSQVNGVVSFCGSIVVDVMIQSEGAIERICALVSRRSPQSAQILDFVRCREQDIFGDGDRCSPLSSALVFSYRSRSRAFSLHLAIRLDKLQLAFSMIMSVVPKRGDNGPTRSAPLQPCASARRSIDKSACVGHVVHQYHARLPIVLLHHLHDQFWSTCGFTCVQLISLRLLRSIRMLRERHSWHSLKSGKARQDWCSGGTPFYLVVKRLLSLLATDLANIPTKEDVECINTTT